MNRKVALLITLVALLCLAGWTGYGQQSRQRDKWEYKIAGHGTETGEQELNELGAQGWELTSVSQDGGRFYLKRKR